jgi:hypothetical protein
MTKIEILALKIGSNKTKIGLFIEKFEQKQKN